ncbi:MAG: TetR/AcrR family transcriptional regulator [Chlorobi bacterium]|nr:TetR/AcrR family transcriptional regulator [Chlorobiota bacterium]
MKTKDKILLTAQKLFFTKGIDRTAIKEISEDAGINIAAVNYHFRSKENLIDLVFEKVISEFAPALPDILDSDKPIEIKLKEYISELNRLLLKFNPHLPFFIMSMMQRNPERILELKIFTKLYNPELFYGQLKEEAEKGHINKVNPQHFFLTVLSLVGYPFSMQHILTGINNWEEDGFEKFIKEREDMVYNILIDILKGKNKDYIL